ncbi:UDP-glucose 4-epimerase GalE [Salimicrobium salexigens]|uniref:UDP-glucose 4-epimerase n=1 Tax=Salimicrobium salexigens TaxID=908941 RepID=A0ABY1L1D2_9BACI|nr:UDP-glucose 4-epimerase GalE [Salimicrobium salexigens]SIS95989.1 UDP-galactose 4-epimerase [Salimicrobium salexigens]
MKKNARNSKGTVLVTGGAGYLGSHTSVALLEAGYNVVVADNLANGYEENIKKVEEITGASVTFYRADVTDEQALQKIFTEHSFDAVMHFAGLKSVKESFARALDYYHTNVSGTVTLAKVCNAFGVQKFIFSSSATVYGENQVPFTEHMPLKPTINPYGETKSMCERVLQDFSLMNPEFSIAILRYFNPVGAHASGKIGENPRGIPDNIMPYITQVATGKLERLHIFGNDYETPDGTCIRDFVHVMDIAEGHVKTMEHLDGGAVVYNLGTGKGTSVKELIYTFQQVNNIRVPHEFAARREGDIEICYADTGKVNREIGWRAARTVADMCRDAWQYELALMKEKATLLEASRGGGTFIDMEKKV